MYYYYKFSNRMQFANLHIFIQESFFLLQTWEIDHRYKLHLYDVFGSIETMRGGAKLL